jgi:NAD(P)-dependent dehydrogenase (short-subunit alcohol dehydrogenase family)
MYDLYRIELIFFETLFCFQSRSTESNSESNVNITKAPASNTPSNDQAPFFFPADVTNEQQIQDMFNKVKQRYGRVDAVINCAGIGVAFRTYNINKVRISK